MNRRERDWTEDGNWGGRYESLKDDKSGREEIGIRFTANIRECKRCDIQLPCNVTAVMLLYVFSSRCIGLLWIDIFSLNRFFVIFFVTGVCIRTSANFNN